MGRFYFNLAMLFSWIKLDDVVSAIYYFSYYNSSEVCRCYLTAGRNSCSGDVSDCSVSTVSPSWHEFVSQFGLAIFFIREERPKTRGNRVARASVYLNEHD